MEDRKEIKFHVIITLIIVLIFYASLKNSEVKIKENTNKELSKDLYNMVEELKEESKKHRLNLVISKIEEISKDGSITYEEIKLLKEAFQENKKIKLINQLKD